VVTRGLQRQKREGIEKDWSTDIKLQLEEISSSVLLHARVTVVNKSILHISK
jgi:hypothetical protein